VNRFCIRNGKRKGSIGKHLPARDEKAKGINNADVAELVDARDLKSLDGNVVWVRVPPPAPRFALTGYAWRSHAETVRAKRVRHSLSEAKATTDW
jgi:hypothetical protein